MKRVLFVCTHNSARSQIAEALLRRLGDGKFDAHSAGTEPGTLHPLAVEVMDEIGVDISGQRAKGLDACAGQHFDYVVTVCDDARESCPVFPGSEQVHWTIPDPSSTEGDADRRRQAFRAARDLLRERVDAFVRNEGNDA